MQVGEMVEGMKFLGECVLRKKDQDRTPANNSTKGEGREMKSTTGSWKVREVKGAKESGILETN